MVLTIVLKYIFKNCSMWVGAIYVFDLHWGKIWVLVNTEINY